MAEFALLPPFTRFVFQGGEVACKTAGDAFRLALPAQACRANSDQDRAAIWLGPDEFLLLAPAAEMASIATGMTKALARIPHSLVEVSARQVGISVRGRDASALLNSGCPLDLDPSAFPPGACARTLLGKSEIVLWRKAAEEYHLEVWRSFSDYVVGWLREAGESTPS